MIEKVIVVGQSYSSFKKVWVHDHPDLVGFYVHPSDHHKIVGMDVRHMVVDVMSPMTKMGLQTGYAYLYSTLLAAFSVYGTKIDWLDELPGAGEQDLLFPQPGPPNIYTCSVCGEPNSCSGPYVMCGDCSASGGLLPGDPDSDEVPAVLQHGGCSSATFHVKTTTNSPGAFGIPQWIAPKPLKSSKPSVDLLSESLAELKKKYFYADGHLKELSAQWADLKWDSPHSDPFKDLLSFKNKLKNADG